MKRRDAIKKITAIGALALFPTSILLSDNKIKPLHIVGIGYSGSHLVKLVHQKGMEAKYTIINDNKLPKMPSNINFIEYIPPFKYTFNLPKHGEIKISDMSQKITVPTEVKNLTAHNCRFVLLAGFGGYTGTYMTEELTYLLNKNNKKFFTVCSYPFDFDRNGKQNRKKIARETIQKLQSISDISCIECDSIRKKYGNLPVEKAFEQVDKEMMEVVTQVK